MALTQSEFFSLIEERRRALTGSDVPAAFRPLLKPVRYKGLHGGRGSGKSHFFGEQLVRKALATNALRWVCIREVQKDLKHSAKHLIEGKIAKLGVGSKFRCMDKEIITPGGGLIIFQGMQSHTADSIKSLEDFDGAWVEEAQALSHRSLRLLRPTLRKPGSEIWFSWNPDSPEDPVDELLRGEKRIPQWEEGRDPKRSALVAEVNYSDNPWLTEELEAERLTDLDRNADDYEHVWGGAYLTISDAIIFARRTHVADFQTPANARFFYGVDWGFAVDPTVMIRSYIDEATRTLYIDHEVYGHQVEMDGLPALFDRIPDSRKWPIKADCSRPETISYVRNRGFNISGAEKWDGSVEDGIAHLKAFKNIVIHERCPQIAREFRLYSYKVDAKSGDVLPLIVSKFDHGPDGVRYSLDGYIKKRGGGMSTSDWRQLREKAESYGRGAR